MTGMEALQHCMQNKQTYIRRKAWHTNMYILVANEYREDGLPPIRITTSHDYDMVNFGKVADRFMPATSIELAFEQLFFDDWIVEVW